MATEQKKAHTEDPEEKIESVIDRTEQFIHKNGKALIGAVLALVIVAGGYMAYKHLYQAKRAEKAGAMMYGAQQNMAGGMWDAALNGDGNQSGFLDVISLYGNTPQGNIAKHYAGECYLKLGQPDEALDYLAQYRETSGVPNAIINAQNAGLQGDIYTDKGDFARATELYGKAVKAGNDPYTTPMYLKKMGLALTAAGRTAEATDAYQRILDDYPASIEARDAEKYLGAASQL